MSVTKIVWVLLSVAGWFDGGQLPVDDDPPAPKQPIVAGKSPEAERAMAAFVKPSGWSVQLFAAEPDVANPVAIDVDFQNRVFVCESFRQERGIEDNREHPEWLIEDIAAQTVADRERYIRRHAEDIAEYYEQDDRIRLLTDADGDGVADNSLVIADRFNSVLSGTGAGVLSYRGTIWYTCIPDLWSLKLDANGTTDRKKMISGFGVRFAFRGHDLHGLTVGPDGRLYFSIGDRGYHVSDEISDPASGAVFRCELDGTKLEVVATGLRNPQELAFDQYGNLFTGDNNSDSGDLARWVYVVPGGDSGWRMHYQYLPDRGPFNREKIWHPYDAETPAYIVPPVDNLADGPSGLAFYPGSGLGDEYANRFFLCDFRGQTKNSGVRTILNKPDGAFFKIAENEQTIWDILATDVHFGIDGRIYVSDWVHGWVGEGKGRIYTFFDQEQINSDRVRETRDLLGGGIESLKKQQLVALLQHPDFRVRREAQFELVHQQAVEQLMDSARDESAGVLARIHAIWGLAQLGRRDPSLVQALAPTILDLLGAKDAEIRAQSAHAAGDLALLAARDRLGSLVATDASSRVRYFCAMSLGRLKGSAGADQIMEMIEQNRNRDPILRHAGIMALYRMNDRQVLERAAKHPSQPVRLAACVAMRRLGLANVSRFLDDSDPAIALEAARAIYDLPIDSQMGKLAAMIDRVHLPEPLVHRCLAANFRLGDRLAAERVVSLVANSDAPDGLRTEAIELLRQWTVPPPLDPFLGNFRPLEKRRIEIAAGAIESRLEEIVQFNDLLKLPIIFLAAELNLPCAAKLLFAVALDEQLDASSRARAIRIITELNDPKSAASEQQLIESGLSHANDEIYIAVVGLLAARHPSQAIPALDEAATGRSRIRRQYAMQILASMDDQASAELIERLLERATDGNVPADTMLDLVRAAEKRAASKISHKLNRLQRKLALSSSLGKYILALDGGDAERGRKIFFERTDVACLRCHKVVEDGGDVGPELTVIAREKTRQYLLESIIRPDLVIAKDFETTIIADEDGLLYSGIIKEQNQTSVTIIDAEARLKTIDRDSIVDMTLGKSSMPEDIVEKLSLEDLRDLIEYLAGLK